MRYIKLAYIFQTFSKGMEGVLELLLKSENVSLERSWGGKLKSVRPVLAVLAEYVSYHILALHLKSLNVVCFV